MTNEVSGGIRQPLLLKLFFVFLATGILILSVVAVHMAWYMPRSSAPARLFRLNLEQYSVSLSAEIEGDFDRATQLTNELGIEIRIENPDGKIWESGHDIPAGDVLSAHIDANADGDVKHGRFHRGLFSQLERNGVKYTFYLPPPKPVRDWLRQIMWLIAALVLIMVFSFLVVRRLIYPLRILMGGVDAIAAGHLDYQLSLRPGDEFESLARAFNQMAERVREMVKAREQLLLDLSHELRSPVTRMTVATEFVVPEDLKSKLKADLYEMEAMVNDVLEGARLGSPHGGLNLTEVEPVKLLRKLVEKYSKVEMQTVGIVAPIKIDVMRITSALRNLIENALKYSFDDPRPVEVTLREAQGGLAIEVSDHGIGIPPEEQSLIFEPFYRIDKSRTRNTGGFGLGLNLCKRVVEAHGGRISLNSAPGSGTTFRIWLPRDAPAVPVQG